MVNTNEIRAYMARRRLNITKVAKEMGVSSKTLSDKLAKHPENFTQWEMEALVNILKIDDPSIIFFAS